MPPSAKLSTAMMFVQSTDRLYAPREAGLALFNEGGSPLTGGATDQVPLWDAGTEVHQKAGVGLDQASRQAGPGIGTDEEGVVQLAAEMCTYPESVIQLIITAAR